MERLEPKYLAKNLVEMKEAYYNGTPLVSDEEFDELEDRLRKLDPDNDYFKIVGAGAISENKRKHKIAMGSQAKIKIDDDGEDGIAKVIDQFFSKGDVIVSYKMDGISVAVDYDKGEFLHATTRGDGFVGDDIPNAIEFMGIPVEVDHELTFTARGELMITYEDFEKINAELPEDEKFSNPRNAVAGIARKVDSPYRKYIRVYYYDLVADEVVVDYKYQLLGLLEDIFGAENMVKYDIRPSGPDFRELAVDLNETRKELPYMIDGLVIEVDNLDLFNSLGVANGNKPKGSVALKFDAVAETTHVTDVVWQVGSTGNLTPVVEFEPTLIDGSIVRRASIHNYDIFKEWNFSEGDKIEVQKNNDIIPQVKSVVERSMRDEYVEPNACPDCGSALELIKVAKTTNLVCTDPTCPAKYEGNIRKWAAKSGMTSKGIGDAFIEAYCASNKFHGPCDLYSLSVDDIMDLSDRYKEKSATKIYNAIQSSKTMKLMDFFGGLNIYGAGSRTFKKIIDAKCGLDVTSVLDYVLNNDITEVEGIGNITADSIEDGVVALEDTIQTLAMIIDIEVENLPSADGKSFLFTGSFNTEDPDTGKGYKRKALEALVASKGHKAASSVNKDLDYLVTSDPDSTSSKMVKARKLGVTILGEDEFFGMMV